MRIYKLHTNEGERYVRSTDKRLRAAMWVYIKEKRSKGYKLSEILFCWGPIVVSGQI